jgi:hypothetical protein
MNDKQINLNTITGQIFSKALDLLDQNPEGIRWKDLNEALHELHPEFHPKTINGCIWKLVEKFPDRVYKPSKGVFRLIKYRV